MHTDWLRIRAVLAAVVTGLVTTVGCGTTATSGGAPDSRLYATEGPGGAASGNVDCETPITGGFNRGIFDNGAVTDGPREALEIGFEESGVDGIRSGYRASERDGDRVLYSAEYGGRTRQAVIVHRGRSVDGVGWYVESWARCDLAELPPSVARAARVRLWEDPEGRPVPTDVIESYPGAAHCDWQRMTFLELGRRVYVRAPEPGLGDYFDQPYESDVRLPPDAVSTGYRRGGQRLWLSRDRGLAFVGNRQGVEQWPATTEHLGCA